MLPAPVPGLTHAAPTVVSPGVASRDDVVCVVPDPNVETYNRAYSLFFCVYVWIRGVTAWQPVSHSPCRVRCACCPPTSYFVVCTTVLMNIVEGVVIEAYCLHEAKKKAVRTVSQPQTAQRQLYQRALTPVTRAWV